MYVFVLRNNALNIIKEKKKRKEPWIIWNNIYFVSDPLVDEMCDFENPDLCRYQSNCTIGSKFQWARGSGETPSRDTGPYHDGSGNPLGGTPQILDLLFKC